MPATLTVNRNSSEDAQQREIIITLDGERIAELTFGQTISREVSAGSHTLLVDNTWNKQNATFAVRENETITFLVQNTSSRFSQFLLMIFGAGPLRVSLTRK
jgi:hypothetical protein